MADRLDRHSLEKGASALLNMGVKAVLVKGGHLHWQQHCSDYYFSRDCRWQLTSARITTAHGHGTGCVYASDIATAMALDYPLADAACIARAYINQGLKSATGVGSGPGPVAHLGWPQKLADFAVFRPDHESAPSISGFPALKERQLGLYPVVDSLDWVKKLLQWGVTTLQLRLKRPPDQRLEAEISQAIELANCYKALYQRSLAACD